jgi:hypothetical protein
MVDGYFKVCGSSLDGPSSDYQQEAISREIDLKHEQTEIVDYMIKFLYHGDYDDKWQYSSVNFP